MSHEWCGKTLATLESAQENGGTRYRSAVDYTPILRAYPEHGATNVSQGRPGTNDLVHEVENARIYAGFHYHHSVIQGRVLGLKVGHHLMQRYFGEAK